MDDDGNNVLGVRVPTGHRTGGQRPRALKVEACVFYVDEKEDQPTASSFQEDEQAALEALCFLSAASLPAETAGAVSGDEDDDYEPSPRRQVSPRAGRQRHSHPVRRKREAGDAGLDDSDYEPEQQRRQQRQQRPRRQSQAQQGDNGAQLLEQLGQRGEGLAGEAQHERPAKRPRNSRKSHSSGAWADEQQQEHEGRQQQQQARQQRQASGSGNHPSGMDSAVIKEALSTKLRPNGVTSPEHTNGRCLQSPNKQQHNGSGDAAAHTTAPHRPHALNLPQGSAPGLEGTAAAPAAIAAAAAAAAHLGIDRSGPLVSGPFGPMFGADVEAWLHAQAGLWPAAAALKHAPLAGLLPAGSAPLGPGFKAPSVPPHGPGAAPSDFTAAIPTKPSPAAASTPAALPLSRTASGAAGDAEPHKPFQPPCPGSSCHVYIANFIAACEQRKHAAEAAARSSSAEAAAALLPVSAVLAAANHQQHTEPGLAAAASALLMGQLPKLPLLPPHLSGGVSRSNGLLLPPGVVPSLGNGPVLPPVLPMSLMPPALLANGVAASAAAVAAAAAAGLLPPGLGGPHAAAAAAAAGAAPFLMGGAGPHPAAAATLAQGLGLHGGVPGLGPMGSFPQLGGLNPRPLLPFSYPPPAAPVPPLAAAMSRALGSAAALNLNVGPSPSDPLLAALKDDPERLRRGGSGISQLASQPSRDLGEVMWQLELLAGRGAPAAVGPADMLAAGKAMAAAAAAAQQANAAGALPAALGAGVPPDVAAAFAAARALKQQPQLPPGSNGAVVPPLHDLPGLHGLPPDVVQRLWHAHMGGAAAAAGAEPGRPGAVLGGPHADAPTAAAPQLPPSSSAMALGSSSGTWQQQLGALRADVEALLRVQGGASPELLVTLERLLKDLSLPQPGAPKPLPTPQQLLLFARSVAGQLPPLPAPHHAPPLPDFAAALVGLGALQRPLLQPPEWAALAASNGLVLNPTTPAPKPEQSPASQQAANGGGHEGPNSRLREQVEALVKLQGGASPQLAASLHKVLADLELFAGQGKPLHITPPTVLMIAKAKAASAGMAPDALLAGELLGRPGGLPGPPFHGMPGGPFPGATSAALRGLGMPLPPFGGMNMNGMELHGLLGLAQHANGMTPQEGGVHVRSSEVQ